MLLNHRAGYYRYGISVISGVVLICLCLFLSTLDTAANDNPLTTLTEDEKIWLEKNIDSIELWFNPDFPPLEFQDSDGNFSGVGADVISLLESRLGVSFIKTVCKDWNRHLKALESGTCAIAPTIVYTSDRDRYTQFTTPYANVPVVIITTESLGNNLTLKELEGRRVAVVKGYATETYVRQNARGRFEVVAVDSVETGLADVSFNNVDAFIGNLAVAAWYIHQNGISNLHVAGKTDYSFVFRIGVSRKYPELYSIIQKALNTIDPESLDTVYKRWISLRVQKGVSKETLYLVVLAGAFLVILVICLGAISLILKRHLNNRIARLDLAQKEIVTSEERYRELFFKAPVPLIEIDYDGNFLRFNDAISHALGYTIAEVPTIDIWFEKAYPDPIYRKTVKNAWNSAMETAAQATGPVDLGERRIRCKDGTIKVFLASASSIGASIMVTLNDIDDRKKMELELSTSRERFSLLFNLAPFSCVINDFSGRYIMVNDYLCESVNRTRDQIIGRTMEELGRTILKEDADVVFDEIKRNGFCPPREITLIDHENNKRIHSFFASRVIDWGDQKVVLSATVDITEKKAAEELLRQQEEYLRVTLDSIGDAVIATDTESRIVRMNPVAERLTGWKMTEARSRPLNEVFVIVDAKTRKTADDPVSKVLSSGDIVGLANHTLLIARDGSEYQIADSGAPIRNDAGTILGVVLVFRDVTQEYTLEEQLRQSQKMQALGQLAGGVAHDFNNMLGAIIGAAELLDDPIDDAAIRREYLAMIVSSAQRAADLTKKLLTFSRKQQAEMVPIDIQKPLWDAIALIRQTADKRITIETDISDESFEIRGNIAQIQNALLNLFINATHAMPHGGELKIGMHRIVQNDPVHTSSGFTIQPGHYVAIEVRDTGCGIPHEHLSRIFDPFFTTKDEDKGTGLGLSTVFGTVEQHEGAITVDSDPGAGTCFRLLFPVSNRTVASNDTVKASIQGGTGRIMVVDDEPAVRMVAETILTKLGYDVMTAENGREAIELFNAEQGAFDLVILDMIMPEMNGIDCFNVLREMKSDVRVVLSSGFSCEEDINAMKKNGLSGMIKKPFLKAELDTVVRNAFLS